jgi:hypothetical protein
MTTGHDRTSSTSTDVATDLVGGRRDDRGMTALPKLSATEKHDVLVDRGWRCRVDGKW